MHLLMVPTYCGGKLMIGMHMSNNDWTADMYKAAAKHQNRINETHSYGSQWDEYQRGNRADGTPQTYNLVPRNVQDFAYLLRSHMASLSNIIGTVTVVTNRNQEANGVDKHLKACGFVAAANTEKYGGYGYCTTWVGDVHKKVIPAINKLIDANYKPEVLGGAKPAAKKRLFSAFADTDR